jgi:uncharacterized protein YlaI
MKVKCIICKNMHFIDYCSLINPNDKNKYIESLIIKAKLNTKKGKKTYLCDICGS